MAKTESTGGDVEGMIGDLTSRLETLREELLEQERTFNAKKEEFIKLSGVQSITYSQRIIFETPQSYYIHYRGGVSILTNPLFFSILCRYGHFS